MSSNTIRICNLTITELDNIDFDNHRVVDESKIIKITKEANSKVKYIRIGGISTSLEETEIENIPMRKYAISINSKWYYILHRLTTSLYDTEILKFKLTELLEPNI